MLPQCGRGLHHREHISRPLDRCPQSREGTAPHSRLRLCCDLRELDRQVWLADTEEGKRAHIPTPIADKRLEDGLSINIKRGNVGYKQRTKHLTTATYLPKRKVVYQPCSRLRVVRQPLKVWERKWGHDRYRQYVATALPMVLALLRQSLLVVTTLTLFKNAPITQLVEIVPRFSSCVLMCRRFESYWVSQCSFCVCSNALCFP